MLHEGLSVGFRDGSGELRGVGGALDEGAVDVVEGAEDREAVGQSAGVACGLGVEGLDVLIDEADVGYDLGDACDG